MTLHAGAVCAAALLLLAVDPSGQPQSNAPAFEVASIKANVTGEMARGVRFYPPSGRVVVTNLTLRDLITRAYQIQDYQLAGGPAWIETNHYDIVASAEGNPSPQQRWLMLRALLIERFKLSVHSETRELPIYALVVARSDQRLGPRLQPSTSDCSHAPSAPAGPPDPNRPSPCGGMFAGPGRINFRGVTLADFVRMGLSARLERMVIDRTGLDGRFDLEVEFAPESRALAASDSPAGAERAATDQPSIFSALQEQLGLKLDARRGPVEVLVIDRAEPPIPN